MWPKMDGSMERWIILETGNGIDRIVANVAEFPSIPSMLAFQIYTSKIIETTFMYILFK